MPSNNSNNKTTLEPENDICSVSSSKFYIQATYRRSGLFAADSNTLDLYYVAIMVTAAVVTAGRCHSRLIAADQPPIRRGRPVRASGNLRPAGSRHTPAGVSRTRRG